LPAAVAVVLGKTMQMEMAVAVAVLAATKRQPYPLLLQHTLS
jgi:hypothetical protein